MGRLRRLMLQGMPVEAVFLSSRLCPGASFRRLRLEHWDKNTLSVFVALVLGLQITSPAVLGQLILLFLLIVVFIREASRLPELLSVHPQCPTPWQGSARRPRRHFSWGTMTPSSRKLGKR